MFVNVCITADLQLSLITMSFYKLSSYTRHSEGLAECFVMQRRNSVLLLYRGLRGRDSMIAGFACTNAYAISAYLH